MRFPRASGIFLHVTSLPGGSGIGDLGSAAFKFVDFLVKSAQGIWQVLPLCPPACNNSPYSSYSAFAGNRLLISPEELVRDGWLQAADMPPIDTSDNTSETQVNYSAVAEHKDASFEKAFAQSRSRLKVDERFDSFCRENAWWLHEFARFEAMMRYFGEPNWTRWPSELVQRRASAIAHWDERLSDQIEFSKFLQFVFDTQWYRVKEYANARGIRIFGDMSIFVAHESSDVWANQSLFCLDGTGQPTSVAGVPPDYFTQDGQLWDHPLYRWDVLESTNFAWWTNRFRRALQQFDLLRVDHFRGFESYWEIPAGATSARHGRWRTGPKEKPFEAAREALGELPIIAEDLGMITQEVHDLRDRLGFPPMRVLQFGFEQADDDFHRPNRYPEHCVAYTGTHDNDTVMGWYLDRHNRNGGNDLVKRFLEGDRDVHLQLVQMVLDSAADTAIIPLQDLLGLNHTARMNIPGQAEGNWEWRARSRDLTDELATRIREMTEWANRSPTCRKAPGSTRFDATCGS